MVRSVRLRSVIICGASLAPGLWRDRLSFLLIAVRVSSLKLLDCSLLPTSWSGASGESSSVSSTPVTIRSSPGTSQPRNLGHCLFLDHCLCLRCTCARNCVWNIEFMGRNVLVLDEKWRLFACCLWRHCRRKY